MNNSGLFTLTQLLEWGKTTCRLASVGVGRGSQGRVGVTAGSLRQCQQDVLHQHGADDHLLAVDGQLGRPVLFSCHGNQHQAAAGHGAAGKPVDGRTRRRRRRSGRTEGQSAEVKAAKRSEVKLRPRLRVRSQKAQRRPDQGFRICTSGL